MYNMYVSVYVKQRQVATHTYIYIYMYMYVCVHMHIHGCTGQSALIDVSRSHLYV